MIEILFGIHILLSVGLIGVVLVQQGKGADLGASLGGGGSNTMFGAAGGADFMTKLTTGLAISFFVTSVLLAKSYGDITTVSVEPVNPLEGSVVAVPVPESQETGTTDNVAASDVEVPAEEAAAVPGEEVEAPVEAAAEEVAAEKSEEKAADTVKEAPANQ